MDAWTAAGREFKTVRRPIFLQHLALFVGAMDIGLYCEPTRSAASKPGLLRLIHRAG